jgi:type II secretory pathway predicted ATPase ExeA
MAELMREIDPAAGADASARLAHYGLLTEPFRPTVEIDFPWLGERRREILAAMKAGVLENAGLVLLTGDVGAGKTTLARALEDSIGEAVKVARLDYPGLDPPDFFRVVAIAYGLGDDVVGREMFLQRLLPLLTQAHASGRRVLLVVDEAQSLSREMFEEIGHLAGIEEGNVRLLNILLVGQNELSAIVVGPQHRGLRTRVAACYSIEPLTAAETDEYIRRRMTVAGATHSPFGADAIREIAALSRGAPRLINLIADLALLRGFKAKAESITSGIIAECARDLAPRELGARKPQRRRYALPAASARRATLLRRHRRAVAAAVLAAILIVIGGYFYARDRLDGRRGGPGFVTSPSAGEQGRATRIGDDHPAAAPAPAIGAEPPTTAKRDRENATPASAVAPPSRPSSKDSATGEERKPTGAGRVPQGEPDVASPGSRLTPSSREGAAAERAASDSVTKSPPRPRVAPPANDPESRERPQTPDPGAIIDWLLQRSPGAARSSE